MYMEENKPEEVAAPKSSSGNFIMIAIVVVVLVVAGIGFFAASKSTKPTETMKKESPSPTAMEKKEEKMEQGTVKKIDVSGQNFSFSPSEIKVKKGDSVKIVFTNKSGSHDFVIDEFNVKTDTIKTGATAEVTFTASKSGTFEYYCSVDNHRAMGMKGNLIVE